MKKYLFTVQQGYGKPDAYGFFSSEDEAMNAAYSHLNHGDLFVPDPDLTEPQTVYDWYVNADDVWVTDFTDVKPAPFERVWQDDLGECLNYIAFMDEQDPEFVARQFGGSTPDEITTSVAMVQGILSDVYDAIEEAKVK